MRNTFLALAFITSFSVLSKAQTIAPEHDIPIGQTTQITDWNTLRRSGFYDCDAAKTLNAPNNNSGWFWGLNIGHSANIQTNTQSGRPYYYNGQILMGLNQSATGLPSMYIRSTNQAGEGAWAKVLHDQGEQTIKGTLKVENGITLKNDAQNSAAYEAYGGGIIFGEGSNGNGDGIYMARYNIKQDMSELRINIGDDNNDKFIVGRKFWDQTSFTPMLVVKTAGEGLVGIGGIYEPRSALDVKGEIKADKLTVAGDINARQVKIEINAGADFVFQPDYNLKPLSEVEQFVKTNKHLPEIPSERQMIEEGVNVTDMQIKLLQKIEELTLYMIEQNKQIKELKEENLEIRKLLK
ncbi:pyocin knob domain-containing protein [Dysgonomonas sp. ZJ709]|uniref:pyocin knob domain-containing protein n=1 Tax=Dysgonomonas sp. ZJ709 TaxID=2709797 RepID=UPI001625BC77|nr:pyocin knob domain-containing protein [Dysgonomonas sp. ZJ709]